MTSPATDAPILKASGLSKTFGRKNAQVRAVSDINLHLAAGELLAIVGASGSGKTTLLHLLGGLERPDQGQISVMGHDLHGVSDANVTRRRLQHIGVVFQAFNLMPTLTALDNSALPLLLAGANLRSAREKARERLVEVGLENRLSHRPSQLSGGEQQRVALARALVNDPDIILADEPTGSLDRKNSVLVSQQLRQIATSKTRAVVLVTHDPAVAVLADRVMVLSDGKLADEFSQADVASVEDLSLRLLKSTHAQERAI